MSVLVRPEFGRGEDGAEGGKGACDLGLETAEVGEQYYVCVRESQIASDEGVEAFGDGWEVNSGPLRCFAWSALYHFEEGKIIP